MPTIPPIPIRQQEMAAAYAKAYENPGTEIPVGRIVLCDDCNADWTDRPEPGGILFQSKAICPDCTPKWLKSTAKYKEERFIRARCPPAMSFADWVRELRGPDAHIVVRSGPLSSLMDDPDPPCSNPAGHSWVTEDVERGEGRSYCEWCGRDGDA